MSRADNPVTRVALIRKRDGSCEMGITEVKTRKDLDQTGIRRKREFVAILIRTLSTEKSSRNVPPVVWVEEDQDPIWTEGVSQC